MTPLALELEGFTCYRERTRIEWSASGAELFAITGPTGAGKSTLLDAITYVLYGRTPRLGARGFASLISPGKESLVVQLEFRTARGVFRVTRGLERTSSGATTEVRIETPDESRGTGWRQVDASERVKDANEALEEIVGLDYEGFTRAVLLPQGAFDEFLRGDARLRRQLLSTLLGLDRVDSVQRLAHERAAALKEGIDARRAVIDAEFGDATPEAAQALKGRVEALTAEETQLAERAEAEERRLAGARTEVALLKERAALQARAEELKARRPLMEETRRRLSSAAKAELVRPLAQHRERSSEQLRRANETLALRNRELIALEEALEAALREVTNSTEGAKGEEAELRERIAALNEARPYLESLEAKGGNLTAAAAEARPLDEAAWGRWQTALSLLPSLSRAVTALHAARGAKQREEERGRAAEEAAEVRRAELEALVERGRRLRDAKNAAADAVDAARREDAAAFLRRGLKEEEPCPVCGSRSHEAHPHDPEFGARSQLEELEGAAEEAAVALESALEEHRAKSALCARAEAEASAARERVAAAAEAERRAERAAEEAAADLRHVGFTPPALELGAAQLERGAPEELAAQLKTTMEDALRAHAAATLRLTQRAGVSANSSAELAQRITEAEARLKGVQARLEELRKSATARREAVSLAEQRLEAAREVLEGYETALAEAERQLEEAVSEAGFTDAAAAAAAALPAAERDALEASVRKHESDMERAATRLIAIDAELTLLEERLVGGGELAAAERALSELEAAAAQLRERRESLQRELGKSQYAHEEMRRKVKRSVELRREVSELEGEHALYHQLNLDLHGHRFPEHLLTQVQQLLARRASAILRHVTDGRFDLLLQDGDYLVSDAWAGGELRSARTLSGGESFVASLSLALALSDTLAGNAALGALFLDEGFGTLDRETLEAVSSVLESLTSGGRMVGVITHVPELSDRLPARLLVSKGPAGSRVQWDA